MTVVTDKAAMPRYRKMYVLECTKRLAMPFVISSLDMEYIERVGLDHKLHVNNIRRESEPHELARYTTRQAESTYAGIVGAPFSYSGSPSPASMSPMRVSIVVVVVGGKLVVVDLINEPLRRLAI